MKDEVEGRTEKQRKKRKSKKKNMLRVVSSASSPRPAKRLTEGCNEAQGSGVNMSDTPTFTQPVAETSHCPHTLALISLSLIHTHILAKNPHSNILWAGDAESNTRKIGREKK